jgi:hypothetical protein
MRTESELLLHPRLHTELSGQQLRKQCYAYKAVWTCAECHQAFGSERVGKCHKEVEQYIVLNLLALGI